MSLFSSQKLVTDHSSTKTVRVGCPAHNCGGRCLLIAHLENGHITRLDTDDRPDTFAAPRGRAHAAAPR